MDTGEKLTLCDIFSIKNYYVQIPIIQRDFAQGRESKKSIRNDFLTVLYNSLKNDKPVDLDFVYGYIENSKFIPLDGQQRLTTLFLLHYYLAIKDYKFDEFVTIFQKDEQSKFTYKTRHSSRSFFDNLVIQGNISLSDEFSISEVIKDEKWYFHEWENDATVSGALTMLDAIEDKFKDSNGFYQKITGKNLICFEFLNLDEYNLSDDLYIKMNARGKPLTSFENFKARFEAIIENVDSKLKQEFSISIDTTWCDLFWNLSKEHTPDKPSVDNLFLNYFDFVTELFFNKDEELSFSYDYDFNNFEILKEVYSKKENLKFLIESLKLFAKSKENITEIDNFFNQIFSSEVSSSKINLFEPQTNLFTKLLFNYSSITHLDRFVLYSIIEFHLKFEYDELIVTEEIIDLIRLVRNFVVDINQKGNDNSRDDVIANIRFSNYPEIVSFIDKVISKNPLGSFTKNLENSNYRKEFVQREIEKIKYIDSNPHYKNAIWLLENHPNLKGNLTSLDLILASNLNIENFSNNFVNLWNDVETNDIIRCLLTYGDYTVQVGKCYFGDLWYFGNKDKWIRIFNYANDNLPLILLNLFTDIEKSNQKSIKLSIKKIIASSKVDEEWKELFINYPLMLASETNIYSFRQDDYYKIDALKNYTLRGYHINSIVNSVLKDDDFLYNHKIKNDGWEVDTYESEIKLKHSAYMTPVNKGWYISHSNKDILNALNGLSYKELDKKDILLLPTKKNNMIQSAIKFLNNYYS